MLPKPYIPDYWSPEQALAVYELLDELRERVWDLYHEQIHEQCRIDCGRGRRPARPLSVQRRDPFLSLTRGRHPYRAPAAPHHLRNSPFIRRFAQPLTLHSGAFLPVSSNRAARIVTFGC